MNERGAYPKGVAKREEILRITLEIFGREGERNTTLRMIAKEGGISLTGLMHYFDSKDHLLLEVLRAGDEAADKRFNSPGAARDPGEFLAAAMAENARNPPKVRLYLALAAASTDPGHPAHAYFKERFIRIRQAIADHVEAEQREGRADPALDPSLLATALLAVTDGVQLQWLSDPAIDMADTVRRMWRAMLRGSAGPPASV
ncbi:TetR/AcrR family transcriptional regulator [Nonomuraea sp. NPDC050790]|uniref:TetR/AcrR family transcriptional regulator n=1 Tax=Nonomuraea sp. NPDC050790 TaxID=3364371 RepID=UPI003790DF3B